MKVGFYLQFKDPIYYVYAQIMMASIKKHMPDVRVVQFTDMTSKVVPGVSAVLRKPHAPLSLFRSDHYATASSDGDDWLFIDTDVVLKADVRSVFDDKDFDIAVADRNWPHQPVPAKFAQEMPHNAGIVFSRSQQFWNDIHQEIKTNPPKSDWYGDQKAICDLVKSGRYKTKILDGFQYNYPPATVDDEAKHAKLVHAKGDRKQWLLRFAYNELM